MPAESLTILSPFPKMDHDMEDVDLSDSEELASLLAEASLDSLVMTESSTHSHPVCFDEDAKSEECLMGSLVQPPQKPWSQDSELPIFTTARLMPSQADHSNSMTEESKGSPPPSKPSTSRYKTELCRSFKISGYCRYETKCQFAHGSSELRGVCRHPKYKTELCRTYHTTGFCPYGFRCHFIHNIEEEKLNNSKKGQCPPFLRQSISCSGIPSMSSSSGSLFSSHIASPASLPTFPPISPLSPTNPLGGTGFWTPSPVTVGPALLGLVTPPRSTVQNLWLESPQIKPFPCEQVEPKMADNRDSLMQQNSIEESTSICDDSEEAKRLPIFSSISD